MRAAIWFLVASVFALPITGEYKQRLPPISEEPPYLQDTSFQQTPYFGEFYGPDDPADEPIEIEIVLEKQKILPPLAFSPNPNESHRRQKIHQTKPKRENELTDIIKDWGVTNATYKKFMVDRERVYDLVEDKKVKVKLELIDALLLQSIAGDNNVLAPYGHSPFGLQYNEWLEWKKLKGLSKKEAAKRMIDYVNLILKVHMMKERKESEENGFSKKILPPLAFSPNPKDFYESHRRQIIHQTKPKRENELTDIIKDWGVTNATYKKFMADRERVYDLIEDKKVKVMLVLNDALLLQSIAGDNNVLAPYGHSPFGLQYNEWLEWKKLKGLSKKEAAKRMIDYVNLILKVHMMKERKESEENGIIKEKTGLKRYKAKANLI
jgi:acyl-CoA-binding protein